MASYDVAGSVHESLFRGAAIVAGGADCKVTFYSESSAAAPQHCRAGLTVSRLAHTLSNTLEHSRTHTVSHTLSHTHTLDH